MRRLHPYILVLSLFVLFSQQVISLTQSTSQQNNDAPASKAKPKQNQPNCTKNGTYENSKGQTVPRPENCSVAPKGATAECRDGSYSFSQSRRGTCSHHGGVANWLARPN